MLIVFDSLWKSKSNICDGVYVYMSVCACMWHLLKHKITQKSTASGSTSYSKHSLAFG